MKNEPKIVINDIDIGDGCAMTIRVALEVFGGTLSEKDELDQAYIDRIHDIRVIMGLIE